MTDLDPEPLVLHHEAVTAGPIGHETEGCCVVLTFSAVADMARVARMLTSFGEALVVLPERWTIYTTPAALEQVRVHHGFRVERR